MCGYKYTTIPTNDAPPVVRINFKIDNAKLRFYRFTYWKLLKIETDRDLSFGLFVLTPPALEVSVTIFTPFVIFLLPLCFAGK